MAQAELDGRTFHLERWPAAADDRRQAWDAADEYVLRILREQPPEPGARLLLIDDSWGALGVALAGRQPTVWNDSHLSRLALERNLAQNGLDGQALRFVPADATPPGPYDVVILRLPKALERLAHLIWQMRPALVEGATVITAGMIKHTPVRAWRLLERGIGPTTTTPGWKKARLGIARFTAPPLAAPVVPSPYRIPADGLNMESLPGIFSAGHLDAGAALLMRHIPATEALLAAADLGCGNGVLALVLAHRCPSARVLGVDESYLAIASARANLAANRDVLKDIDRVAFVVADGLREAAAGSLDLVLCNPPFHQLHSVADLAAERLFAQGRDALRIGGTMLVVGNRHLGHHAKLDRVFGNHRLIDGDGRFVVLEAIRAV